MDKGFMKLLLHLDSIKNPQMSKNKRYIVNDISSLVKIDWEDN